MLKYELVEPIRSQVSEIGKQPVNKYIKLLLIVTLLRWTRNALVKRGIE